MKMKNTIPEVDSYIEAAADFAQPILRKLRQLFHRACPEIQESIKWSSPFFEHQGIVGKMSAFKRHVSYGFWKAALRQDHRALATFKGFNYSNRKDYVEWVTEAKREATRENRLATTVERLTEGKPRNRKYRKDWR